MANVPLPSGVALLGKEMVVKEAERGGGTREDAEAGLSKTTVRMRQGSWVGL